MNSLGRIRRNTAAVIPLLRTLAFGEYGVLPEGMDEPVVSLKRVQVFAADDYRNIGKGEYTEQDIQDFADHWNDKGHTPPITLDHAQWGPAYGLFERCWAEGKKLFADLKNVPKSMAAAIKNGRFPTRSMEFYSDWKQRGLPSIKCVTFTGAQPPSAKGMDPVLCSDGPALDFKVFGDDPGDLISVPFTADPEPVQFADVPADPAPDSHGVIVRTEGVDSNLEHRHNAYLDETGNGFTSNPVCYDWEYDRDLRNFPDHVHVVKDWVVQPAGTPPHTHDMSVYFGSLQTKGATEMSDKTSPENNAARVAAETNKTKESETAMSGITAEQFSDLQNTVTALQGKVEAAEKSAADANNRANQIFNDARERENLRRFSDTFQECFDKGKVDPAEKDGLLKTFLTLCKADSSVEKFSDAPKADDPSQIFLDSLKARAPSVQLGVMQFGDHAPRVSGGGAASEEAAEDRLRKKAREYQSDQAKQGNMMTFSDALEHVAIEERGR